MCTPAVPPKNSYRNRTPKCAPNAPAVVKGIAIGPLASGSWAPYPPSNIPLELLCISGSGTLGDAMNIIYPRDPSTCSKGTWILQTHPRHLLRGYLDP